MVPVFIGGALRWLLERRASSSEAASQRVERGVLLGSGLVGGEGLIGVGIAAAAFIQGRAPKLVGYEWLGGAAPWLSFAAFIALVAVYGRACVRVVR